MKTVKRCLSVTFVSLFLYSVAFGQAPAAPSGEGSRLTGGAHTSPSSSPSGSGLVAPVAIPVSQGNNAHDQAKAASGAQGNGAMLGMLAAAASAAIAASACPQCATTPPGPQCPICPPAIAGIGIGIMTAMSQSKGQSDSEKTAAAVAGPGFTPSPYINDPEGRVTDSSEYRAVQQQLSRLPGVKTDLRAGKFSVNGKSYSTGDFQSDASMAAAGMSPSDIAAAKNMMKKVQADVKAAAALRGLDGSDSFGDGIALGGARGNVGPGYNDLGAGAAGAATAAREKVDVSGLKKDFNGTPIGVAQANLFTLVHNRYEVVAARNDVLTPLATSAVPSAIAAPAATSSRLPASGR